MTDHMFLSPCPMKCGLTGGCEHCRLPVDESNTAIQPDIIYSPPPTFDRPTPDLVEVTVTLDANSDEQVVLFPGRFQPFHDGHRAIIQRLLDEGRRVLVLIRDTVISPDNPYSFMERANMIREVFTDSENVIINPIPDFEEIVYGRTPGWRVRSVDTGHEKISASAIRSNGRIIWLTGNSGSGKSTLADMLEPLIPGSIVLHGDEMRASISKYEGFGPLDRTRHCRRVGRLAGILAARGHTVLVAVIAPFHTLRVLAESDSGREITWIYVKRDSLDWGSERPYTPPVSPDFTVDTDLLTPEQAVEQILSALDVYPSDGYTGRREEIDGK